MTKWPQNAWLIKSMVVMVMLIFASNSVVRCGPTSPEPTSTPASFSYSVRVRAEDTGEPIPNVEIKIEVGGKAILDEITDSNGYARIFIDSSYVGQPGRLIVDATDYERCEKNIDLTEGALPEVIRLQEKPGAVLLSPTPIMPLSTTITPTTIPPYPAPTLVSPAFEATIMGAQRTKFSWHWDGALQEGEKYDLQMWRSGKAPYSVSIGRQCNVLLDIPPDGFGDYLWRVSVVRVDESGKSILSESQIWPFVWNDVLPTPTSTTTPTLTPEPDAVVNVKALNLRSGPGTVYDILGVLKQGDHLKVAGRSRASDWLKVIAPGGEEGWVAASCLEINIPLAGMSTAQAPPTPTPIYTLTPVATPTPTSLPPPIPLEPENGAAFLGEPVLLKWRWDRPRAPDEVFSVRVRGEGETKLCHHDKADKPEYKASLSYCTAGTHYWSVALVRDLDPGLPESDVHRWQNLSEPSEERWFYYVPVEEPWTWPTPDSGGGDEPKEPPK